MKRPIKKIGSAVMAGLFLVSLMTCGCSFNPERAVIRDESGLELSGKMPDKLPDGLSWYDFKEDDELYDILSQTIGDYFVSDVTWFDNRTWMFLCETEPQLPVYHIVSFDKDNKQISDCVIRNEFGDNISLNQMIAGNRLYIAAYDFATRRDYLYPVDDEGCISPDNKIDLTKNLSENEAFARFAFIGDDVAQLQLADVPLIEVVDPVNGTVRKKVSLENLNRDFNIKYPDGIICAGEDKVVVYGITSANCYFGQTRYCLVDLNTGKIDAMDELEYVDIPLRNLSYCNGSLATVTDGGVYIIDTENGTCKMTLSFNCSNCNRFLVNNSELKYADEEMFLFSYSSRYAGFNQTNDALCKFTRTSDYPAAGKNILTVASTEDLDYSISEAIMRFNSESSSSYMLFDSRYKANRDIDYSNTDNAENAAVNALTSYASVSDRLAMDIISGKGPDIIITDGANEQLSKSEYFVDLTDYLFNESGINESEYFINAIDSMKFNGALYQLPVGFYVDGFIAQGESFGHKNGLTFDEYSAMVKNICNGQDPVYDHQLYYSRTEVATKLFANASEIFIRDGKIDVNNEAFRAILDYCRDLPAKGFFEGKDIEMEYEDLMNEKESMCVQPVVIYGFFEFEEFAKKYDDIMVCGYPSLDGRSAAVGSDIAVSVSSRSDDINACKEFLGILLSEDIQQTISSNIPVNKKCAREHALMEIELNNEYAEKSYGVQYAKPGTFLDPSAADRYIEQLSTATTSEFVYHSISLIIYEEIPAYFDGQKSFEDVAGVINDRAQKVLDERK